MADFTRKVIKVTMTGIDYSGKERVEVRTVETHGDNEQARYVITTQDWPAQMRKVETWEYERVA